MLSRHVCRSANTARVEVPVVIETKTMSEMIESAKQDGFTHSFKAEPGGLRVLETNELLRPDQVTIVHYERFEGPSSEDDKEALYYIETTAGLRGILVDAYGTYADENVANFIRKVDVED